MLRALQARCTFDRADLFQQRERIQTARRALNLFTCDLVDFASWHFDRLIRRRNATGLLSW
jgi:hypothetical protein